MIVFITCVLSFFATEAFANRPFRGVYEVPTVTPDLRPFSSYPIRFESNTNDVMTANELVLQLPEELVGSPYEFKISRANNEWSGPDVSAVDCQVISRDFVCRLAFHAVNVEMPLVEQNLRQMYPNMNEETLSRYLKVSLQFSDEPIGILKYRLRGRDRQR